MQYVSLLVNEFKGVGTAWASIWNWDLYIWKKRNIYNSTTLLPIEYKYMNNHYKKTNEFLHSISSEIRRKKQFSTKEIVGSFLEKKFVKISSGCLTK